MFHDSTRLFNIKKLLNFTGMKTLFILISFYSTVFSVGISYKLQAVKENSLTIQFKSSTTDTSDHEHFFAFSTQPGQPFQIRCTANNSQGSSLLPVKTHSSGWFGTSYLQWCSFLIRKSDKNRDFNGIIQIDFSSPLYAGIKASDISLQNGVIQADLSQRLYKKSSVSLPPVPFVHGVRIEVSQDGMYEISADSLSALGVPISRIESRFYRLYNQNREVPISITDPYKKYLQSGDRIRFYGRHLRGASTFYTQYSNTNVYWLTWGTTPGTRIAEVSGGRRRDPAKYSSSSQLLAIDFKDTVHFEIDSDIRFLGNITNQPLDELTDPPGIDTTDNWYWGFFGEEELATYKIILPSPAGTGNVRFKISFTGLTSIEESAMDHQTSILFNNDPAGANNTAVWDGQQSFIFSSDSFPPEKLKNGTNEFSFICKSRDYPDRIALNWIEVEYSRNYVALNNTLTFKNSSDALGNVKEYQLSDFTSDSIEIWDITKSRHFNDIILVNQTNSGKSTRKFTAIFQDSIASNSTYFASAGNSFLKPEFMSLDTIVSEWQAYANADYIIISADSLRETFEPLIKCHTRNGLKTIFAAIEDIYNRFSSGIKDPESIRTFLKYICSRGGHVPRYLLLGGDTTHDLDKKNRSRNIVPTHLSRIPGWGPAADDGYFTTVIGEDDFPDIIIGRFPAQNKTELKTLVDKTVNYINKPDRGFWRDNVLLLGGGESVFSAFNTYVQSTVIGNKMNITRLDADSGSYFYKDGFIAPKLIADNINTGVLFVNFNGHGGGNIWSDNNFFGYKDLNRLYNGQWGTGGRLPVIFSFTCLTGFFESVSYRSLGEEFIRTDRNGAICFYGASSYTSLTGNIIMNKLMLESIFNGSFKTIGELINFCEMNMLVQYGTQYRHLVRQYNLLGDPALPLNLTPDTMQITLSENHSDSNHILTTKTKTAPVNKGNIRISINNGPELWEQRIDSLNNGHYSSSIRIKKDAVVTNGMIRAYAWNDSSEIRGWAQFSKDSIYIENVYLSEKNPVFGDSVHILCTFQTDSGANPPELYCLYALAPDITADINFTGLRMIKKDSKTWISLNKIPLPYSGKLYDRLLVLFRIADQSNTRQSSISVFPINGLPDLVFTHNSPKIYWAKDSLRSSFEILNTGNATANLFRTHFFVNNKGSIIDTLAIIKSTDSLKPGKTQSFTLTLPDTQGSIFYLGYINYYNDFRELYTDNNTFTINSSIHTKILKKVTDTLVSENTGTYFIPGRTFATPHKIFVIEDTIKQKSPLQTSSQWALFNDSTPVSFTFGSRSPMSTTDSLYVIQKMVKSCAGNKIISMIYDSSIATWRYYAPVQANGSDDYRTTINSSGPLTFACVSDITPPDIMISVDGRTMRFLDYASKDKPFSIFISDPSGINPSSITLSLNKRKLGTGDYSSIPQNGDLRSITLTAYPQTEHKTDSLEISVEDLAGNAISKVFTYKTGDGLAVKFLSCNPNPFSARTAQDGSRQPIIFAFVLTDIADDVTLTIYTVSGKPIRSWILSNIIGYHEIRWDGRDSHDFRIANGTYYAKLEAKKDKIMTKKIIRIAKLEGY